MSVTLGPKLGLLINADIGEVVVDTMRPFLRFIDAALMGSVINSTTTVPPVGPSNGDAYLLLGTPTGAWLGKSNAIAVWSTEITLPSTNTKVPGWDFWTPKEGWAIWELAAGGFWIFTQGQWTRSVNIGNKAQPGVGTSLCYDQLHTLANVSMTSTDPTATLDCAIPATFAGKTMLGAALALGIASVTTNTTLTPSSTKPVILVDAVAGNLTLTLPAASSNLLYFIKRQDSSASLNTVTISPVEGETIEAENGVTMANMASIALLGSDTNWSVIATSPVDSGSTLPKIITVASSSTPTFDFSQALTQKMVLTSDTTLSFTGAQAGDRVAVLLVQDATGNHNLTWGSHILGVTGGGWPASTSGLFQFVFDGTNYLSTGSPIVGM